MIVNPGLTPSVGATTAPVIIQPTANPQTIHVQPAGKTIYPGTVIATATTPLQQLAQSQPTLISYPTAQYPNQIAYIQPNGSLISNGTQQQQFFTQPTYFAPQQMQAQQQPVYYYYGGGTPVNTSMPAPMSIMAASPYCQPQQLPPPSHMFSLQPQLQPQQQQMIGHNMIGAGQMMYMMPANTSQQQAQLLPRPNPS